MKKLWLISLAIVAVTIFVVGGCAKPTAPAPTTGPAPAAGPNEILIGENTSLSGPFAGFGIGGTYGEQAAADDLNKLGGIYVKDLGKKLPIKLIVVDNESDPTKAGALEEQLIVSSKVNFLAHPNLPLVIDIPQAIAADKYKTLRLTGANPMEPWLGVNNTTPPFQYSWTCSFSIATPAPKGTPFDRPGFTSMEAWRKVLDQFGDQTNKKVGVFASDEPDGRGWYLALPQALEAWGYNPIGVDKNLGLFPPDTTDFSSIVNEWKANDAQILCGNCIGTPFGVLLRQSKAMGFKPKMICATRAAVFYEDIAAWGGDLPNGVCTDMFWCPAMKVPGIGDTTPQTLADRWAKDTGGKPMSWTAVYPGYWPLQVLADAIERAGSLDTEKVSKAISETTIPTMICDTTWFNENHLTNFPISFGQWQKTNPPANWELRVISSDMDYMPVTTKPIFPIP
jgi:branched-chain amino acid transport system substrate-binding protein